MAFLNYMTREVVYSLVYYGPLGAGKMTSLKQLHHLNPEPRGKVQYVSRQAELTTRLDVLAPDVPPFAGYRVRLALSTLSGWGYHEADRQALLRGADGVMFVADSQRDRLADNVASLDELGENLRAQGFDPATMPLVLVYNKRDLADLTPVDELNAALNPHGRPWFECVATRGLGVLDALNALARSL
jgi:mutual gliding-motility protein MglA